MTKTFDTIYGEATVRNAMLEENDNTTLTDGIEIKVDGIELIEIYEYYNIEQLTQSQIELLIKLNL